MSNESPKLPLPTFLYAVTFFAGLYWGISFHSGAWGDSITLPLLAPPFFCVGMATVFAERDTRRIILGAVTLYVNFLLTFSVGYVLVEAGVVRFLYPSQK
jgi:hypothetical protein